MRIGELEDMNEMKGKQVNAKVKKGTENGKSGEGKQKINVLFRIKRKEKNRKRPMEKKTNGRCVWKKYFSNEQSRKKRTKKRENACTYILQPFCGGTLSAQVV